MVNGDQGSNENYIDLHRRRFLLGMASSPIAGAALSQGVNAASNREITVSQNGTPVATVAPYSHGMPVEKFYSYNGQYRGSQNSSANTPNDVTLEEDSVSQLFFHEYDGELSLVMIHDKPNSDSGGDHRVVFDGLPDSGSWVVKDDRNHAPDDYPSDGSYAQWGWGACCTDGGAYRWSADEDVEFTINPRGHTRREGSAFDGIDTWKLQSGDGRTETLDMGSSVTITIGASDSPGGDLPTLVEEKQALAGQISDLSVGIDETQRVDETLTELVNQVDAGEVDEELAKEAVTRMKHGENLSEMLLAGFSPRSVPATEDPQTLVGLESQYGAYDVAGNLVDVGISWLLELLMGIAVLMKVSKYFFGLKGLARTALSRSRKGVRVVTRTLFGKFPQIQRTIRATASGINDDVLNFIQNGVTEGGKLATQIAAKITGVRDGIANQIVELFEDDPGLVVPTDVDSKLAELDAAVAGGDDRTPDLGGGTDVDVEGIASDAQDALDEEIGNTNTLLTTAEAAVLAVTFLSLTASLIVAATGIGIVASGTIEFATILLNLGITTLSGIGALTTMQHSLHNHNKGVDAIVEGDEGVSYTVL